MKINALQSLLKTIQKTSLENVTPNAPSDYTNVANKNAADNILKTDNKRRRKIF